MAALLALDAGENSDSMQPVVFLQNSCYLHRYIRSKDTSAIVETPERLRAVALGISATIARLETGHNEPTMKDTTGTSELESGDITTALGRMNLADDRSNIAKQSLHANHSTSSVDMLNHAAVKFIHGDIDGNIYLENLRRWSRESRDKIMSGQSEIPEGLSQGDLYLCPESIDAIQGALGTVCEAVDCVIQSSKMEHNSNASSSRAFVAIRPPGHHCGESSPSGFCFVNNVAVGAAHAHLQHHINRVVILDIDLHHGNGTQSIVWQINEETHRQTRETETGSSETKPGMRIFYGSIHDILSYPCEDGKPELVQAASVSIHGNHGQYIENIHLEEYTSEGQFWNDLYPNKYSKLLARARDFMDSTGGPGDDALVFLSCGFDACEHEFASMSRHNRKVPASFYYRFTCDTRDFSDQYTKGRLISVLEGGYSDRALISGTMAHLCGLTKADCIDAVDERWWNVDSLVKIENCTKRRKARPSVPDAPVEPWLERTIDIFSSLTVPKTSVRYQHHPTRSSMTLRDRTKKPTGQPTASVSQTLADVGTVSVGVKTPKPSQGKGLPDSPIIAASDLEDSKFSSTSGTGKSFASSNSNPLPEPKRLPKIILRLGPRPST